MIFGIAFDNVIEISYICSHNLQNMSQKILLNSKEVNIILHRLACQLIEKHLDFSNTILIGIQPRGTFLANRLSQILKNDYLVSDLKLGLLDAHQTNNPYKNIFFPRHIRNLLRLKKYWGKFHFLFNPRRKHF